MRSRLASLLFLSIALTSAAAFASPPVETTEKAPAPKAAPASHGPSLPARVASNTPHATPSKVAAPSHVSETRPTATPVSAHAAATEPASIAKPAPTSFVRNGVRDPSRDGSNGGQWFKDNLGGDWFGKPGKGDPLDMDRMGNEHATAGIYKVAEGAFGTSAPELRVTTIEGKAFLMSKKIPLSESKQFTEEQLKKFGDGFVIDAWLANWDIGGGWQLTADASGKPVRVDGGGAGLFRARGEPKGAAFGDEVGELTTMRDPLRPISAGFRKVTDKDVKDQIQKFASWYPAHKGEVDAAIDGTSMSPVAATQLKTKLANRAQWLINQAKK